MLMQVDEASVIKSQVEALRDDVRQKMRDGKIALSAASPPSRAAFSSASPIQAERDKAYSLLQSLSQPIGGPLAGGNGRTLDVSETDSGVQLTLTDAALADKVRHAVSQSIEVLNRRINAMGTKETDIAQQGVEPGADRGAGSSGHQQTQGDHRADRQARIPAGGRSGRCAERGRAAADAEGRRDGHRPEACDGRRRGPGRRPAELRPTERRARRHLPLQPARWTEVRAGHDRECRPSVRHRARRQGHLGAGHPLAHHRRHRPDNRQFQHRRGEQPGDPAARRRLARQAHRGRGAHGRAGARPGLDRRRQARGLCRRDPGRGVHDRDLRRFRHLRRPRARACISC